MRRIVAIFAVLLLFDPAITHADSIIYVNDSTGNLLTANPTTGVSVLIGNTGTLLTDIAFAPNGDLYGVTSNDLYRINPSTAAATRIGVLSAVGQLNANALTFGNDGTLYAASNTTAALYTVDRATGLASTIGTTGFISSGDLAFLDGALFLSATGGGPTGNLLVKINPADVSHNSVVGNMGILNVYGLAASDGVLYGVAGANAFAIDTSTAAPTLRSRILTAGTSYGATASPTPEPAAVLLLSTGLLWLGRRGWMRGQRPKTSSSSTDSSRVG